MEFKKFFILILLFVSLIVEAQQIDEYKLSEVTVEGLTKTERSVTHRLMQQEIGDQVTLEQIAYDAQQLQNYPALDDVEFKIDTIGEEVKVTYTCLLYTSPSPRD